MSYRPAAPNHDGLWWQIALGIFVGQLMTGAVAIVLVLATGAYMATETEKAMKPLMRQLEKAGAPIEASRPGTRTDRQPPAYRRPLSDGERCIKGERFRRLPNGWEQLRNDPCF